MRTATTSAQVVTLVEEVYSLLEQIVALELNEDSYDDSSHDASNNASPSNVRSSTASPTNNETTSTPTQAPPNPRRRLQALNSCFPAFDFGDRVLILSSDKHYHKQATITGIYGEQFWWVRTDLGESFRKKYSSLRKLD